ncbi:trimethylamine methyltransferase family protein [Candidatus Neomarinimicrobiota bacterium]
MRPTVKYLSDHLIGEIIADAREVLCSQGVEIKDESMIDLLDSYGAEINAASQRVVLTPYLIDKALNTISGEFALYDTSGAQTHDFSGDNFHFNPGSAALNILDHQSQTARPPQTDDYIDFVKLVHNLPNLEAQSTAIIPADVPAAISDSYRLFLNLLYGTKPVITGVFAPESFQVMLDFQLAIRGSARDLRSKPMTVFTCCPTSPLKWSVTASRNLTDCVKAGIPVELVTMPMAGFTSPVTIIGTLVQQTAEILSGIVMAQLAEPGAPLLYGCAATVFDIKYSTTPLSAPESMVLACASNEIGKYLGLPTQAYISLSNAKLLDAQAGLETGMGATMAVLAGINSISGPGLLDFVNCQSLEKLVVDHEIARMAARLTWPLESADDLPAGQLMDELIRDEHLLISPHSLAQREKAQQLPGSIIERSGRQSWLDAGGSTVRDRAHTEVERLIAAYEGNSLRGDIQAELIVLMEREAQKHGLDTLPERSN